MSLCELPVFLFFTPQSNKYLLIYSSVVLRNLHLNQTKKWEDSCEMASVSLRQKFVALTADGWLCTSSLRLHSTLNQLKWLWERLKGSQDRNGASHVRAGNGPNRMWRCAHQLISWWRSAGQLRERRRSGHTFITEALPWMYCALGADRTTHAASSVSQSECRKSLTCCVLWGWERQEEHTDVSLSFTFPQSHFLSLTLFPSSCHCALKNIKCIYF